MKISEARRGFEAVNIPRVTAAWKWLVQYGTYSRERIKELEQVKRSLLGGEILNRKAQLELAEYLLLSGQLSKDQAVPHTARPFWAPPQNDRFNALNDIIIDAKDGNSYGFGRMVGMYCSSASCDWAFTRFMRVLLLKAGGNIIEIGSGHSRGAIRYAAEHPDKNITAIDANALNILGAYDNLQKEGLIINPLTNLRIMLGDICSIKLPPPQRADLIIAQSVINRSGDDRADALILEAMIANCAPSAKLLIIPGTGPIVRTFVSAVTGKAFSTEFRMADNRTAEVYI